MKKDEEPVVSLKFDNSGAPPPGGSRPPEFATLQSRGSLLSDFFRALLVILSLVVAAGFILILLPQPTVDKMADRLEARRGVQPERVALLYLGDEITNNQFHVRGAVRNIATEPIERLDAAIRLYGHDGTILQTVVVRMNKESIAPDEIAHFELVYPDYKMEFAKYAVEFKLREGGEVRYKDMRAAR